MWLLAEVEPILIADGFRREPDCRWRFSKVRHPLMIGIEEHRYRGGQKERGTIVKFQLSLFNPTGEGPLTWAVVLTGWFQGDHVASENNPSAHLITTPENRPSLASRFVDVGLRWTRETVSLEWISQEIERRIKERRQLVKRGRRPVNRLLSFGQPAPRESPYDYFCASLAAWHLGERKKAFIHAEQYATFLNDAESRKWLDYLKCA